MRVRKILLTDLSERQAYKIRLLREALEQLVGHYLDAQPSVPRARCPQCLARRGCGPARAIVTPDAPPAIAAAPEGNDSGGQHRRPACRRRRRPIACIDAGDIDAGETSAHRIEGEALLVVTDGGEAQPSEEPDRGPWVSHARIDAGDRGPWVSLPLRATIPEGNPVGQHADVDVGP